MNWPRGCTRPHREQTCPEAGVCENGVAGTAESAGGCTSGCKLRPNSSKSLDIGDQCLCRQGKAATVGVGCRSRRVTQLPRRGCQAVLRPAGEDMLRAMWPVYSTVLRDHFAGALSAEEAQTLAELLGRVARTA